MTIFPMMLHGAQCWASAVSSSTRIADLNIVLAVAAWIVFMRERTKFSGASLALASLEPARYHILRRLACYKVRNHETDPTSS